MCSLFKRELALELHIVALDFSCKRAYRTGSSSKHSLLYFVSGCWMRA